MQYRFSPAIFLVAWFGLFQSALAEEAPRALSTPEPVYLQDIGSDASVPAAKPPAATNQTVAENAALKDVKVYPSF